LERRCFYRALIVVFPRSFLGTAAKKHDE
jgi:hypothetical protein